MGHVAPAGSGRVAAEYVLELIVPVVTAPVFDVLFQDKTYLFVTQATVINILPPVWGALEPVQTSPPPMSKYENSRLNGRLV